jgi:dipeptide/tripeptide permease
MSDNEKTPEYPNATHDQALLHSDYEGKPTLEELQTLRRIPGPMPTVAYLICAVEFAERASFYGIKQLIGNYVNRPLPKGGNGWGAPPKGTQETAGALGLGTVKANAVAQSFSMMVYMLPVFFGWLADTKTGRFKQICGGVAVFGVAHVILMAGAAKSLLENGNAKIPFFIGLYVLAIGACMHNMPLTLSTLSLLTKTISYVQAKRFSPPP